MQAVAEFQHVCLSEPPSTCPLELQMLWGLARLQLAAGLVEHWAAELRWVQRPWVGRAVVARVLL